MAQIPGGVSGRRNNALLPAHGDDVRGVPSAGPLAVVGVNSAALESRHRALQAARLVQGVRVDSNLPGEWASLLKNKSRPWKSRSFDVG